MGNSEKITVGKHEQHHAPSGDIERIGEQQREALRDLHEHVETSKEVLGTVRHEAITKAESIGARDVRDRSPAERRGPITKKQLETSFRVKMNETQDDLHPIERTFSKFIHNKAVESTSDAVGASVARPNALLAGSISAFLLVTIVYLLAKNFGYPLSGFETIGAFILGWILGLIYDYFHAALRSK